MTDKQTTIAALDAVDADPKMRAEREAAWSDSMTTQLDDMRACAGEWAEQANKLLAENVRLEAALRELEDANDAVAALRPQTAYDATIAVPGAGDALLRLDDARRRARELLT